VKFEKNASDTCAVPFQAYGWGRSREEVESFEWHKLFIEGHENVEDDERNGSPKYHRTYENIEKAWNVVRSYRHLSIRVMTVCL
jgi:hypothetical protein